MSDCLWGLLDGMNDAGLAVSLTFGGRRVLGDGFGIPIVVRYLLETCETVAEARERARPGCPYSLAHNLTVVDRGGEVLTAYLSPDREPIFRAFPAATNHQGIVEWPEQARATRTVERERCISGAARRPRDDRGRRSTEAFLRAPLSQHRVRERLRHPVHGGLPPGRGGRRLPLADSVDALGCGVRGGPAHRGARRGLRRLSFAGDESLLGVHRLAVEDSGRHRRRGVTSWRTLSRALLRRRMDPRDRQAASLLDRSDPSCPWAKVLVRLREVRDRCSGSTHPSYRMRPPRTNIGGLDADGTIDADRRRSSCSSARGSSSRSEPTPRSAP